MKIVLSTRNPSKTEQIKAIFAESPITILTLAEAGIQGEAVEDGQTLQENALKKALFARRPGCWAMADDTGLFIKALNGEPGIKAARWAGEKATSEQTIEYTLEALKGKIDRTAHFETVAALVSPEGKEYFFTGRVYGSILEAPKGKVQPKMPYSSLFVLPVINKVWAEMTLEEENRVSHRGKAFRQAREFLEDLLEK